MSSNSLPFPSLSSFLSDKLTPPSPVPIFAGFPSHQHQQWLPIMKSNSKGIIEQKSLSSLIGYRPSNHRIVIYNSISNTSLVIEPDMGTLLALLQEFGLDESETEALVIKNPALKITSFSYIRTRILSLQSLGIIGFMLYRLITKSPDVLTAIEVELSITFFRDELKGKIEPIQIERFLASTEPRFLLGFDKKVNLLLQHNIPQEKIAHVLNNVNLTKVFSLKSFEEIEKTLAYLDRFGGSDIIVRRPMILHYDLVTHLIPKIDFLTELNGGDEIATGTVLRKLPAILSYSLDHLHGHVELLRSFAGFTNDEIFKIFLVFPNVISASKKRKLYPRIEFLKQCGLNSDEIYKFLIKAPLFLGLSFEDNLAVKLNFLVKIGFEYRTKELTIAMGPITRTSCDNLQKVIGLFLDYGLSFEEILVMIKKHPQILQYKFTSLEEKMEYLIEGMGRNVEELLSFPAFLGYNLDERIKHRYEVKKKTIGEGMSLNKLLSVSTERFSKRKNKKKLIATPLIDDN